MHDLQTIGRMNKEADKRAFEADARKDYIRFTHDEVSWTREFLANISNPSTIARAVIRKFEMIHELQLEAHQKNVARFKENER